MKQKFTLIIICGMILCSAIIPLNLIAQNSLQRDTLITAAREIIKETSYCGLITIDSTGQPQVRTMNPFPDNERNDHLVCHFKNQP